MFSREPSTVLRSSRGWRASAKRRPSRCSSGGTSVREPGRERGEQVGQVGGGPVARHVRLAEADRARCSRGGGRTPPVARSASPATPGPPRPMRSPPANTTRTGSVRTARRNRASAMRARSADVRWGGQARPDAFGGPWHEVVVRPPGDGVRGHWTPSCGAWRGRGMTGRRRSHSAMPCRRMRADVRSVTSGWRSHHADERARGGGACAPRPRVATSAVEPFCRNVIARPAARRARAGASGTRRRRGGTARRRTPSPPVPGPRRRGAAGSSAARRRCCAPRRRRTRATRRAGGTSRP